MHAAAESATANASAKMARGALIGKAFLYGLGALGEAGVATAIEIIRKELDVSMALTAQRDVRSVSAGILERTERGRRHE